MDALRLALALGLPWLAGAAWVRLGWRERRPGAGAVVAGYGFLLGALATTLLLRLQDLAGLRLGFGAPALALAALAAVALATERRRRPLRLQPTPREPSPAGERLALLAIAAILALRFAGLAAELVWRPLFAWDGWATWGARARVWFERRELVPFVAWAEWVERAPEVYTIPAWHYPASVPLLQVWTSLAIGRWDDSLMSLPWLGCACALGLALYGQLRLWGVAPLGAAAAAYALLSLPVLDAQVGLPGGADLWQAAVYGTAAFAFLLWWRDGDRRQGLLALLLAAGCAAIKRPGLAWALTLLVPLALARLSLPRALLAAVAAAAALPLAGRALGVSVAPRPAAGAVAESLFALASWHLLWYGLAAVAVLRARRLARDTRLRPLLLLVSAGLGFLGAVYLLTPRAEWALDFTQLNRALLHLVPLLVFAAAAALDSGGSGPTSGGGAARALGSGAAGAPGATSDRVRPAGRGSGLGYNHVSSTCARHRHCARAVSRSFSTIHRASGAGDRPATARLSGHSTARRAFTAGGLRFPDARYAAERASANGTAVSRLPSPEDAERAVRLRLGTTAARGGGAPRREWESFRRIAAPQSRTAGRAPGPRRHGAGGTGPLSSRHECRGLLGAERERGEGLALRTGPGRRCPPHHHRRLVDRH